MDIHKDILITDLYELSMLQGYFDSDMHEEAVFEFFVRDLPPGRGYLVACGLEWVLEFLENAQFTRRDLQWIKSTSRFSKALIDYLQEFRFSGDVHAMVEGSIFFPGEPILRVRAPIAQAQLVETRIINLLQYSILIATKAARCVQAAPEKLLVDFGLRRAHGAEAGLMAAYASYLAGFAGTSNVSAAPQLNIPVYGTMAHSFVQAHDSEIQAFINFARAQPENVTLLIDTYDTEAAAHKLAGLVPMLKDENINVKAIRLDSGNLGEHAFKVRGILDSNGLHEVKIFASGGIDEYILSDLIKSGAPIDGFGVGSKLNTSADAPYLDCAYKLVEYAGIPRRKLSEKKATLPGSKQVYRHYDNQCYISGDVVTLEKERSADKQSGEPLLQPVFLQGNRVNPRKSFAELREYHKQQMNKLPPALKKLDAHSSYPVSISKSLIELGEKTDRYIQRQAEEDTLVAV
jgi:nicotinate phosphoribosyltransferase